ncbi:hypothetical protein FRX31_016598 [Thalictrum thalictroides]|uniref:RNase H type-1 domain-containing protein n=1 Tax=Thalictrum thalictroides TaxID=46969 RepID=A0A7J6W8U0_THATH|nr:hypothetical protein FRX31_016598 [Thalictrum thalictroides]
MPGSQGVTEWISPPPGWIKINFDTSYMSDIKQGAVAAIAIEGHILAGSIKRIKTMDAKEAEFQAAELAVKLAVNLNYLDVHLEGDNYNVINCLANKTTPPWNSS